MLNWHFKIYQLILCKYNYPYYKSNSKNKNFKRKNYFTNMIKNIIILIIKNFII